MVQLEVLSLSQHMLRFEDRPVLVEFVMGRVALGQVLVPHSLPVGMIPPVLHTYLFIYIQCYIIVAVDSIIK